MSGNVRHPAPLNQFYRLEYDEVAKLWTKAARWNNTRIVNGHVHNFDGENCMATAGAVAVDAHTNGRIRSTPPQIRNAQYDLSGGIGVDDVDVAWHRLWDLDLLSPFDFDWLDVIHALQERRHVVIGVDYGRVPYAYQVQKGGTFDHALNLDDYRESDGAILRQDPLGTRFEWIPQYAVRAAAEALAYRVRGRRDQLFVGVTAQRPAIEKLYRVSVHPLSGHATREFGLYQVVNGQVVSTRKAITHGFSATAKDREFYAWPGHPRQELVRIITGAIADSREPLDYVRAGYITGEVDA